MIVISRTEPRVLRAEAEREAEELYNRLRDTVEDGVASIRQRKGEGMARLVIACLIRMETSVPAAGGLLD